MVDGCTTTVSGTPRTSRTHNIFFFQIQALIPLLHLTKEYATQYPIRTAIYTTYCFTFDILTVNMSAVDH